MQDELGERTKRHFCLIIALQWRAPIGYYLLSFFLRHFVIPDFVNQWLEMSYRLSLDNIEKIPETKDSLTEKLLKELHVELMAFGLNSVGSKYPEVEEAPTVEKISKLNAKSYSEKFGASFAERYSAAVLKYRKTGKKGSKKTFAVWNKSIELILNPLDRIIKKSLSQEENTERERMEFRERLTEVALSGRVADIIGLAFVDILNYLSDDETVCGISRHIRKEELNESKLLEMLEEGGLGLDYYVKIRDDKKRKEMYRKYDENEFYDTNEF